jgi:hypothetical protein
VSTVTLRPRTLVATLVTATLIGMGARGLITPPHPASPPAAANATVETPGPRSETAGVPTGFARSRAGATAAAVTYVRQGQRVFDLIGPDRTRALQAIVSRAATGGYLAQASAQLAELDGIEGRGNGPLIWDVSVLATRVDAYTAQRALVSIWRVGVLSIGGLTAPLAEWTTVAYELVWERGDWRIWSETQSPGPTPMGHPDERPSTPEQLRAALAGFARFPGPDPL